MNKRYIPGTNPAMDRELPDGDANSLVDKNGEKYDNGYNFDEKNNDSSGKTTLDGLTKEADNFDPDRAKIERQRKTAELEGGKVISLGEVSRMVEDESGDPKLKSAYLDVHRHYLTNGDYDRECLEDEELSQSIKLICTNAAHLDLDQDAKECLSNIGTIDFKGWLNPESVHLYKEIYNEMIKNIKGKNQEHQNTLYAAIQEMGKKGKVGESLLHLYEDLKRRKANNKSLKPYDMDE